MPYTRLSTPEPSVKPAFPLKTITRWDTFIGDVASGMSVEKAMEKCYITRADIETMCRLNDGGIERKRYREAKNTGLVQAWSWQDLEDWFTRLAQGITNDDAMMAVRGVRATETNIYQLIAADSDIREWYDEAKKAGSHAISEKILVHADDNSNDTLPGPKGGMIPNMASVTRSKLQVDAYSRYAAWYNMKFSDKQPATQVNIQVNYAKQLAENRERSRLREKFVTPKQIENAIEAVFSEKTPEVTEVTEKAAAEKPLETVWREEE